MLDILDGWMDDVWIDMWMDGRLDRHVNGWMDGRMDVGYIG